MMRYYFILISLVSFGCGPHKTGSKLEVASQAQTSGHDCSKEVKDCPLGQITNGKFYGYSIDGVLTSCIPAPADQFCTMNFTEGDQFNNDCKKAGGISQQCACHSYLCSLNIRGK